MEFQIKARCLNEHQAIRSCCLKACSISASIYQQSDCQYSKIHNKCFSSVNLHDIMTVLVQIGTKTSEVVDKIVLSTTDEMMKRLQTFKEQYQSKKTTQTIKLTGNQNLMYKYIKYGQTKQINSHLILSVIQKLHNYKQGTQTKQHQFESLAKELNETMTTLDNCLNNIKNRFNEYSINQNHSLLEKVNFCFKKQLTTSKVLVQEKDSQIVKISNDKQHTFSLIYPSLNQANNKALKLEIKTKLHNIAVGFASKKIVQKYSFQNSQSKYQGFCLISSKGNVSHIQNRLQHLKDFTFQFKAGDKLLLEYSSITKLFLVKNISNLTTFTFQNFQNHNKDLHYCIYMDGEGDSVKIIS